MVFAHTNTHAIKSKAAVSTVAAAAADDDDVFFLLNTWIQSTLNQQALAWLSLQLIFSWITNALFIFHQHLHLKLGMRKWACFECKPNRMKIKKNDTVVDRDGSTNGTLAATKETSFRIVIESGLKID